MICPEVEQFQNTSIEKDEGICTSNKKIQEECSSMELNSYINPKKWKKSLTNFFRNQLRSAKSNDGDRPSGSQEKFEDKVIAPEQKWQSLGKMFKRQSFVEHWNKSPNHHGETSTETNKRLHVRKVISSYFGKMKHSSNDGNEK